MMSAAGRRIAVERLADTPVAVPASVRGGGLDHRVLAGDLVAATGTSTAARTAAITSR